MYYNIQQDSTLYIILCLRGGPRVDKVLHSGLTEKVNAGQTQATVHRLRGGPRADEVLRSGLTEKVDVGQTQATELKYGTSVKVYSYYTGHDYDYEHCSESTVLCMSIWKDMKFFPLPDLEKILEEEVAEWVQNEGKVLIESLNAVYVTDTCVIDLESEADTIICTCGHQCIHHTNVHSSLRKCPVCRVYITAFVRADGVVVHQR